MCPEIKKFAARTINGTLQIYAFPINAEQIWFPKEPNEVSFVHSIHAGTGIIAGARGRAVIVDIQKTLLVQILAHDGSDATEIRSIAVRVLMNIFHLPSLYLLNTSATMTIMTKIAWLRLPQLKISLFGGHRQSIITN